MPVRPGDGRRYLPRYQIGWQMYLQEGLAASMWPGALAGRGWLYVDEEKRDAAGWLLDAKGRRIPRKAAD